ncbi:MAG: type VI secretion system tip protein VgrG [Flavipsychrobacter sp.]|nr:type VI secretion system tip protein VgrG [Flavipsychrobacter sp.]
MPESGQNSNTDTPSLEVKVNGAVMPADYNMVSLVVNSTVNRLSLARLIFLDGEPATGDFPLSNKADFLPGSEIEIAAGYKGQNVPIFKGIVVKQSLKLQGTGSTFLTVDCRHSAVKATKARKNKIFTGRKDSDLFTSLLQAYGVDADVADTPVEHPEMVQYNCTDWDMIVSRAEANGMLVITDTDKIKIGKPELGGAAVMELRLGVNIIEFDAEMDARHQFQEVKASGWDMAGQAATEAEGQAPAGLEQQGNVSGDDLSGKTGDETMDVKMSTSLTEPELKAWAESLQQKSALSKIRGRLKCQGSDKLKPGVIIDMQGVGERFSGKAFVSAVRHEINQGNWMTDIEIGLSQEWFIKEHDVNSFPAEGMLPAVSGLQVGIVAQLEEDPLGEDRVLVKLPMVDNDAQGVWARHALLDAGKERGSFFRPEVDDEVVVGFVNNDPRYPVILGMMNSSAKPAVVQAKDTNHEKGFVTREKMKLWFDDEKKIIQLLTPGGNSLQMDEDQKVVSIKDQNGNEITMSEDGIVIKSIKDITIEGPSGTIGISGKEFEAEASTKATVKGSSSVEVSSSGSAALKGASVMIN